MGSGVVLTPEQVAAILDALRRARAQCGGDIDGRAAKHAINVAQAILEGL